MEHEVDSDSNCSWCSWNIPKGLERKLLILESEEDQRIIKMGSNTKESPGSLLTHKFTLISAEEDLKNSKGVNH